jgi:hypothetical protein
MKKQSTKKSAPAVPPPSSNYTDFGPHSKLTIRPPFVVHAIAATEQSFSSDRVAISEGQHVILEFGLTQITVHDPHQKSPSESNKLGVILYSYGFSGWDKQLSMDKAAETGQVQAAGIADRTDMWFLIIDTKKEGPKIECRFCGFVWIEPKSKKDKEAQKELIDLHLKEHRLNCDKCR